MSLSSCREEAPARWYQSRHSPNYRNFARISIFDVNSRSIVLFYLRNEPVPIDIGVSKPEPPWQSLQWPLYLK